MGTRETIAVNTGTIYVRTILAAGLALFSNRWIINNLGKVDFGLYSLVGGVLGFLALLNSAMVGSSQRHMAFSIGRGDLRQTRRVFTTCWVVHMCIAGITLLLGLTVGLWFVRHVLNIPASRLEASVVVYLCSLVSCVVSIASVPYGGMFNAKQKIAESSLIGLLQPVLLLGLAYLLFFTAIDKLIFYGMGYMLIMLLMTTLFVIRARLRFAECRLVFDDKWDRSLFREILSFSGWNLFGIAGGVIHGHGLSILINLFFGPAVNASCSIANQVNGQVSRFASGFIHSIGPEIIATEGRGDRARTRRLALRTCRYAGFLALVWVVPVAAELPFLLKVWLKTVPEFTTVFCLITFMLFVMDKITIGYTMAVMAVGRIAWYQITLGLGVMLTLPVAYLGLLFVRWPVTVFIVSLMMTMLRSMGRVAWGWFLVGIPVRAWLFGVFGRLILSILPALVMVYVNIAFVPPSPLRACLSLPLIFTGTALGIVCMGLSATERGQLWAGLRGLMTRYRLPFLHVA